MPDFVKILETKEQLDLVAKLCECKREYQDLKCKNAIGDLKYTLGFDEDKIEKIVPWFEGK